MCFANGVFSFGFEHLTYPDHWICVQSGVLPVGRVVWRSAGTSLHESRNFDQIVWDRFCFELLKKLGGCSVLPFLKQEYSLGKYFFFQTFYFSYWSLCILPCILQLCNLQGVFSSSLYALAAYQKTSVLSNLGNKTLPPDPLKITNIHPAQHIRDVLLQVCAMQRTLTRFCFPGLSLLCMPSSSSEG